MRLCGRAVDDLHVTGADRDQSGEQPLPNAAMGPSIETVVDRRGRAEERRTILPTTAHFQHVNDTAQDPAIILAMRARLVLRQQRLDRIPLCVTQPKFSCHDSIPTILELESRRAKKFNGLIEFGP